MKKLTIIIAISFLLSKIASAGDIIIKVKGSYFYPSDKAFEEIYGGGVMYGGEADIGIWRNLELWVGASYYSKKSELTFTKEKTRLKIIPIGGGVKYRLSARSLNIYGGIGINYYQYEEKNPIGDVGWGELGIVAKIGCAVKGSGGLMTDFYINYSYCKMRPVSNDINVGGVEAGIGIGYRF